MIPLGPPPPQFLFSVLRLCELYWFVLKFPNSVLCHLHSSIDPMQQCFIFTSVFVSFVISICFKRVCYCLLKHVYVCRLKWLSHNSSIRVNLSFGVCWSSFLTHTVSLLVLGMTDDFLFYPGHFVYYVWRMWVLFISFTLAGDCPI